MAFGRAWHVGSASNNAVTIVNSDGDAGGV